MDAGACVRRYMARTTPRVRCLQLSNASALARLQLVGLACWPCWAGGSSRSERAEFIDIEGYSARHLADFLGTKCYLVHQKFVLFMFVKNDISLQKRIRCSQQNVSYFQINYSLIGFELRGLI